MITTLNGYLQLDKFYYTKGKKRDNNKWFPQNEDADWEIIIVAYSKKYVQTNPDLFEKLLQKIHMEEKKESL